MQLRLWRADRPTVRDKQQGGWLAYHAVGGAVTVLEEEGAGGMAGPLAF